MCLLLEGDAVQPASLLAALCALGGHQGHHEPRRGATGVALSQHWGVRVCAYIHGDRYGYVRLSLLSELVQSHAGAEGSLAPTQRSCCFGVCKSEVQQNWLGSGLARLGSSLMAKETELETKPQQSLPLLLILISSSFRNDL